MYNEQLTMIEREVILQPIVSVANLSKTYASGFQSLKKINLDIRRGEIFALLGPNGAGKTTLIKGLVGALRPSGGTARVMGLNPLKERAELRQRIGYMPQGAAPYEDLFARDNVGFCIVGTEKL